MVNVGDLWIEMSGSLVQCFCISVDELRFILL